MLPINRVGVALLWSMRYDNVVWAMTRADGKILLHSLARLGMLASAGPLV